jgi:hypothetical protein
VSEQQAEQTSSEPTSVGAGTSVPTSSDSLIETVMASVREAKAVDAPPVAPEREVPKAEAIKMEMPQMQAPQVEAPKIEALKMEAPKMEAPRMEAPRMEAPKAAEPAADGAQPAGKLLIMSRRDRPAAEEVGPADATPPKRRFAAMAAVVALAVTAGALGGALASAALNRMFEAASAMAPGGSALEAAVARIDADVLALKAGLENTSRLGMSQFNKTNDRLDKIEKAQAEPATRLARISEALERMRATPSAPAVAAVAAAPAAPKETPRETSRETTRDASGSITAPTGAAPLPLPAASPAQVASSAPSAPPKQEAAHPPTVEGWILRDVGNGGALIEGRNGLYEVYAGDPVPGLGRIDAIRKLDGRWVVVTSKGLIVAR